MLDPLERAAETIRAAGGTAETAQVDALAPEAVDDHVQAIAEQFGHLDISFNAIWIRGELQGTPLLEMPVADFTAPVVTAIESNFLTATAAARQMVKQGYGAVLTLSTSSAGLSGRDRRFHKTGGQSTATTAVDAFTRSLAGEGHAELTDYLRKRNKGEGLAVMLLAPGFVYGPGGLFKTAFWDTLEKGQLRVFGKGENYWSSVHVDDLAWAYALAIGGAASGEVVNVVDDAPLRLRTLVDAFTDAAEKPRVGSAPPWLLDFIIGGPLVTSLITSFRVRDEKAKELLSWTPRYPSFKEGIVDVVRELKA